MNPRYAASIGIGIAGGVASIGLPIGSLVESNKQNRNFGSGAGHLIGASVAGGLVSSGAIAGAYALSRKDLAKSLSGFDPGDIASIIAKGIK